MLILLLLTMAPPLQLCHKELPRPAKVENQKLSEERAANVTQYLREKGNIPMRRIMAPADYGATHPAATNSDPQGRELNRRVDVKVLLNKGVV